MLLRALPNPQLTFSPLYPTVIVGEIVDCEFKNLQVNGKMHAFPNFFFILSIQ